MSVDERKKCIDRSLGPLSQTKEKGMWMQLLLVECKVQGTADTGVTPWCNKCFCCCFLGPASTFSTVSYSVHTAPAYSHMRKHLCMC